MLLRASPTGCPRVYAVILKARRRAWRSSRPDSCLSPAAPTPIGERYEMRPPATMSTPAGSAALTGFAPTGAGVDMAVVANREREGVPVLICPPPAIVLGERRNARGTCLSGICRTGEWSLWRNEWRSGTAAQDSQRNAESYAPSERRLEAGFRLSASRSLSSPAYHVLSQNPSMLQIEPRKGMAGQAGGSVVRGCGGVW